jgi:hypothetical protein
MAQLQRRTSPLHIGAKTAVFSAICAQKIFSIFPLSFPPMLAMITEQTLNKDGQAASVEFSGEGLFLASASFAASGLWRFVSHPSRHGRLLSFSGTLTGSVAQRRLTNIPGGTGVSRG